MCASTPHDKDKDEDDRRDSLVADRFHGSPASTASRMAADKLAQVLPLLSPLQRKGAGGIQQRSGFPRTGSYDNLQQRRRQNDFKSYYLLSTPNPDCTSPLGSLESHELGGELGGPDATPLTCMRMGAMPRTGSYDNLRQRRQLDVKSLLFEDPSDLQHSHDILALSPFAMASPEPVTRQEVEGQEEEEGSFICDRKGGGVL